MQILKALKSTLITGLFIVLPAWLALLLFLKILVKLGVIVKPIAGHMPKEINHPTIIALVVFILICLLVGALFHTAIGKIIGHAIQDTILNRIPGYASLRAIAAQTAGLESETDFQPALIVVEDGCLAPAFLIETHEGGFSTVFMPSVPTPMAGGIFIMPSERVHVIDVPVPTMMKCISKWGSGSSDLIAAMKKSGIPFPNKP
jgi:uncharacterized membrane protein